MRQFLKTVLATFVGLILFTALGAGGLALLVLTATTRVEAPKPKLRDKTVLVYDLSLGISDAPIGDSLSLEDALAREPQAEQISLRSLLDSLHAAAKDKNIVGLYLKTGSLSTSAGHATLREVREAITAFRQSGKPVYAYGTDWDERDYYLASAADTIALNPIGGLTINGLSSEIRFYAGAMEKFGVGVQIIRVGRFKAAVEPYTQKALTPENRLQTQALLTSVWGDFLRTVSQARQLKLPQVQTIVNQHGILTAPEARSKKLIDQISHPEELETALGRLTYTNAQSNQPTPPPPKLAPTPKPVSPEPTPAAKPEDPEDPDRPTFRGINLVSYADMVAQRQDNRHDDRIAIIYAEGEIVSGEAPPGLAVGSDTMIELLQDLQKDEAVKAVVLRVNSPGGGATAASLIGHEVERLAQKKPLIVSMGDYAASGGYWISAPAQRIFAEATTITGSIGTFGLLPNVQKLANRNGITWDSVTTAPLANPQTIARPKTPAEMALLQKSADRIYQQFLAVVADNRKLPNAKVAAVAQGRVWSGQDAQKVGLVDEIGGLSDAIKAAAQAAKLKKWTLDEYPQPRSLEKEILERFFTESPFQNRQPPSLPISDLQLSDLQLSEPMQQTVQGIKRDLLRLGFMNDPQGIYTRLPYDLDIQ